MSATDLQQGANLVQRRSGSVARMTVVAVLSSILLVLPLLASGSSRGGVSAGPKGPAATDPFLITHVVKATIVAVDLDSGKFTVRDVESEKLHELAFVPDLKLRAKKKKDFDGRRKLEPTDIKAGQIVKLTIRDADGALLQMRVEGMIET